MWKTQPAQRNYYAVIFSSTKSDNLDGYAEMDELTLTLAQEQDGFLGYESCNNGNAGIFISYWQSIEAIQNWSSNNTPETVKSNAKRWYRRNLSQIFKIEYSHLYAA